MSNQAHCQKELQSPFRMCPECGGIGWHRCGCPEDYEDDDHDEEDGQDDDWNEYEL